MHGPLGGAFKRRVKFRPDEASPRGLPISTLYLERIGPLFDREASALFDHDVMGRDRRPRRLGGLHMARNFRPVVRGRGGGPDAGSRGDKSSYCSQNDDLAHGVTLCGM